MQYKEKTANGLLSNNEIRYDEKNTSPFSYYILKSYLMKMEKNYDFFKNVIIWLIAIIAKYHSVYHRSSKQT